MAVTLVCPNLKCKAMLEVGDDKRGQKVSCTKCGQIILVPARAGKKK